MKKYFEFRIWSLPNQDNDTLIKLVKFLDVLSWMYDYYFIKEEQAHSFKIFIYLCETGRFHFEEDYELTFRKNFNRMQAPHDAYTIRLNINFEALKFAESLEVIYGRIVEVLEDFSKKNKAFNRAVINKISQKILDNNFQFKEYIPSRIANPKNAIEAQFYFQEDMEGAGGFIAFWENEKVINLVQFKPRGCQLIEEQFSGYWLNDTSFRIDSNNKYFKGYWVAQINGEIAFVFDRLNSGNPHHIFMLGEMYFNGELILEDTIRGLELIKKSADQGYKHAVNWLARNNFVVD